MGNTKFAAAAVVLLLLSVSAVSFAQPWIPESKEYKYGFGMMGLPYEDRVEIMKVRMKERTQLSDSEIEILVEEMAEQCPMMRYYK